MKKIALVFGGNSNEHEVSIKSAKEIYKHIDREKYDLQLIGISRDGNFFLQDRITDIISSDSNELNFIANKGVFLKNRKLDIDLFFLAVHGENCEDGKLQSFFELLNLKYTGSDSSASFLSMNKILAKEFAKQSGVEIAKYLQIDKKTYFDYPDSFISKVLLELELPVFVKASSLGSSLGIYKSFSKEELKQNIEKVFKIQNHILIEEDLSDALEIECSVLEVDGEVKSFTTGEIILDKDSTFYDFESKYISSKTKTRIPSNISKKDDKRIQNYAKSIFKHLNCHSYARVDFFYKAGRIYFNEINTLPGFTSISMFPKLIKYSGISYSKLLDIIVANSV